MPILARRNIRAIGTNELIFPLLVVERIELLIEWTRNGSTPHGLELYHLENGARYRADELLFLEPVDDDLLLAMRLEAQILSKRGEAPKRHR